MKKRIKFIFIIFILLINIGSVKALSVSKSNITLKNGENDRVELYADISGSAERVDFKLVYTSNDVRADFIGNSAYNATSTGNTTYRVTFNEPVSGRVMLGVVTIRVVDNPRDTAGGIKISGATATLEDGTTESLGGESINVKVEKEATAETPKPTETPKTPEPTKRPSEPSKTPEASKPSNPSASNPSVQELDEHNGLLEKIESNIVKIALKKDTFDYTLTIKDDVKELDLKPIAKDTDSKIDITSQKISELKDNKITITVTNGDTKQEYNFKIKVKEKNEIVIDNGEFEGDSSYKGKWLVIGIVLLAALIASLLLIKNK